MIYLHHYPASLFSEKIRLLCGYYDLAWQSVEISSIMPRPLLMPLSGGYRRTPVLQIDANVYCDTKIICQALARHVGDAGLYGHGFTAHRVADWADSELFKIMVALNFRPEALAPMMGKFSPEEAEAFAADRAQLSGNQPIASLSAESAMAALQHAFAELEASLAAQQFLFGAEPCIADFSVFHNVWFLHNNPVNQPLLQAYPAILHWLETMNAYGHGQVTEVDGQAALSCARDAEPVLPELTAVNSDLQPGTRVTVTPVDYGCIPVAGELVAMSADEVVLRRDTDECGTLFTHFPQSGFEVARAKA